MNEKVKVIKRSEIDRNKLREKRIEVAAMELYAKKYPDAFQKLCKKMEKK